MIRISGRKTVAEAGHSSPPGSPPDTTPKSIWWSASRITSLRTPSSRNAPSTTSASDSEFDCSGERFSVQTRQVARIQVIAFCQGTAVCTPYPAPRRQPEAGVAVLPPPGEALRPASLGVEERELARDPGEPGAVVVDHPRLERDAPAGRPDEPEEARLLGEVGQRGRLDEPVRA